MLKWYFFYQKPYGLGDQNTFFPKFDRYGRVKCYLQAKDEYILSSLPLQCDKITK